MTYIEASPTRSTNRNLTNPRRRGVSALLAMLFLVIFSTLSIGFYASTTMTVQVSANDERTARAQLAAETGMDFVRRHLAVVRVSPSGTPDEVLGNLAGALQTRLNGTGNLGAAAVAFDGRTITIPAVDLGDGSRFDCTLELVDPAGAAADVVATVNGTVPGPTCTAARTVSMHFRAGERRGAIFDFGMATRSTVTMDSNARVHGISDPAHGTVLITSLDEPALHMRGNSQISGRVSLINPENTVSKTGSARLNGEANPRAAAADPDADIRLDADEPEFPEVDTDAFKHYAGNPLYGGITCSEPGTKYDTTDVKNILIKANTNPEFSSNIRIDGVIYIETPNRVTFSSNTKIRGVIAVENDPHGDPTSNLITFSSNATIQGLDTLPATADFPTELREMAGAIILAPGFRVHVDSNFGAAGGHMVASQFDFDSNARGSICGSVINLDEYPIHMDSNADLAFAPSTFGKGPGLHFSGHFTPDLSSYREGL